MLGAEMVNVSITVSKQIKAETVPVGHYGVCGEQQVHQFKDEFKKLDNHLISLPFQNAVLDNIY